MGESHDSPTYTRDVGSGHASDGVRGSVQLGRLVVAIVLAGVIGLSTAIAVISKYFDGDPFNPEPLVFPAGPQQFSVPADFPHIDLFVLAIVGFVLVVLFSTIADVIATTRTRDPEWAVFRPLLPAPLPDRLIPGALRLIALIPAHNEASSIATTLGSLAMQQPPPDRVIVVADNCTDATVEIARECGAEVFVTEGNTDRKAGALNQALRTLLPTCTSADVILVMDADTVLSTTYTATALDALQRFPLLDAVGGLFYGDPGGGLLGQLQRNEYLRYQGQIIHRRGRVFVLTGTATVFRAEALADVAEARGVLIPGNHGDVYDATALTEDNELTIALKSLGSRMVSPPGCGVRTEVMPTWRALWVQRLRWQRGALENLATYGFTSATLRYWMQQVGIGYGFIALASAYTLLFIILLASDRWVWHPFWIAVTGVFLIERVATVWKGGPPARWLAAPLIIEITYDFFLQIIFLVSLAKIARRSSASWGHSTAPGGATS